MARPGPLIGTAALLVFSRVFGLSVVLPNFRDHFETGLGIPALWVGAALGAHGLSMAAMQWPLGALSDRIGRKPVLLVASALFVAGSVGAAFAHSGPTLLAARLVQGLGAVASVAMAAVGESVPHQRRTQAMAMVGIPAGLGFMVGLALGPVLFPHIGMRGLFVVVAGVGLLAALPLPTLRFAPPSERPIAEGHAMSLPVVAVMAAGFALNYFLYTTLFFLPSSDWRNLLPMLLIAFAFLGVASRTIDKAGLTWQPLAVGLVLLAVSAPLFVQDGSLAAGALFFSGHATLSAAIPSQVSRLAGTAGGRGHGSQNIIGHGGTFLAGSAAGALAATPMLAISVAAAVGVAAAAAVTWGHLRAVPNAAASQNG